jgi:hypothetical protein
LAARLVEFAMQINDTEPAWRTYLRSAAFVAPALLAWGFVAVFVFPKYKQMWVDTKLMDSEYQWIMSSVAFGFDHLNIICAFLALPLLMLEFTRWRSRYRPGIWAGLAFLLNTTILVTLAGVCMIGAIAGPAMAHR